MILLVRYKNENEGEVLRQRFSLGFKINVKTIVI